MLREEAEIAIHGRVHSDRVDAAWLAAARQFWAPTGDLLNEAENHGRHRNWTEARTAYLQAMDTGPINWDPHGTFITEVPLKVATTFALTGEHDRYRALCQELLQHADETQAEYASVALILPEALSPALVEKARRILRRAAARLNDSGTSRPQDDWIWLDLGIAEAHSGNTQEALSALAKARTAFNLNCAGVAFASSAALLVRRGDAADAQQYLAKAGELHQRILAEHPNSLSQHWHETVRLELALTRTHELRSR